MATQTTVTALSTGWVAASSAGEATVVLQNQTSGRHVLFRVATSLPASSVENGFVMDPNEFIRLTDLGGSDIVYVRVSPAGSAELSAVVERLS